MHFNEIDAVLIEVLRESGGHFLFPYQIFNRIKKRDAPLAARIEAEYSAQMGAGAGVYYSPASFVSHALEHINPKYPQELRKVWFDVTPDMQIESVEPGNPTIAAWAWQEDR